MPELQLIIVYLIWNKMIKLFNALHLQFQHKKYSTDVHFKQKKIKLTIFNLYFIVFLLDFFFFRFLQNYLQGYCEIKKQTRSLLTTSVDRATLTKSWFKLVNPRWKMTITSCKSSQKFIYRNTSSKQSKHDRGMINDRGGIMWWGSVSTPFRPVAPAGCSSS